MKAKREKKNLKDLSRNLDRYVMTKYTAFYRVISAYCCLHVVIVYNSSGTLVSFKSLICLSVCHIYCVPDMKSVI